MRTLLVATIGGHLTHLVDIVGRLPEGHDDVRVWVTFDHAHSRPLLEGERSVFVPYVGEKDIRGVLRNVPIAHRLHAEWQFDRVISTGSGLALGYLPYLAARGVQAHYVENATRVSGPSLTGRLLQSFPRVRLYTQYEHLAHGRWHHAGSEFDGFTTVVRPERNMIRRAVVTLGTMHKFGFRRILEVLAPLLRPGGAVERAQGAPVDTVWQTGGTETDGLGIEATQWIPADEMNTALVNADLVVSHAGTGSAYSAMWAGCFPVLVPRLHANGEIGDEHQERFARALDDRGLALYRRVDEIDADDLFHAATRHVLRVTPSPFQLLP